MPPSSLLEMPIHQQASTFDIIVREWICEVLRAHPSVLTIALRQRAKFEGWLKFELAAWAELQGAQDVEVEANSDYTAATRADLTFWWAGVRCDVELKTANTNYRMAGVANIHRPITKNLHGIGRDAGKLRNVIGQGVVSRSQVDGLALVTGQSYAGHI